MRVQATCNRRDPPGRTHRGHPGGEICGLPQHRDGPLAAVDVRPRQPRQNRALSPASYMMLRYQRTALRWATHHASDAADSATLLDPRPIATAGPGSVLAIAAHAPGVTVLPRDDDNGEFSLMMYELARTEGTWAACDYYPDRAEYDVLQHGDRRLWDEVSAAYLWWLAAGRPGPERYGLTVTRDRTEVWLDHPRNPVGR